MPSINDRVTRENRKTEAAARQAAYDALSTEEKVARLDSRLGKNKGAQKERARLAA